MNPETYTIYITDSYGKSEKATIKQTDLELALKDALLLTLIFLIKAFLKKINCCFASIEFTRITSEAKKNLTKEQINQLQSKMGKVFLRKFN